MIAILSPLALAFTWDSSQLPALFGIGLAVLVIGYFGVRFWLVTTRPPAIDDVKTPTLDRHNLSALAHMAEETAEEDAAELEALQHEDAPDDLRDVVPPEPAIKPAKA